MTARRQARAKAPITSSSSGVPRPFLVGRCVEVWADPADSGDPRFSAHRRFGAARRHWLRAAGIAATWEQCALIPLGSPWSLARLAEHGDAGYVREPLARAGVALTDLPRLADEAADLLASVPQNRSVRRWTGDPI